MRSMVFFRHGEWHCSSGQGQTCRFVTSRYYGKLHCGLFHVELKDHGWHAARCVECIAEFGTDDGEESPQDGGVDIAALRG